MDPMFIIFKILRRYILQLKGYLIFGKKVGVLGNFTVANPSNVTIGDHCAVNHGVFILGHHKVEIGSFVVLSTRCMIIDTGLDKHEFVEKDFPKHVNGPIRIEDGAWIGAGATILAGVTIGRKAIVGAGAVVTRAVPPNSIVAGNPARIIGSTDA
jgi:acetyltransferase-like isoleucine patch superfamily enzyme